MPDVPRWTIDDNGDLVCEQGDRTLLVIERRSPMRPHMSRTVAVDALVQCVRDADTLRKARELARGMRTPTCRVNATTGQISDLLDLLTQDSPETDAK